MAQVFSSSSDWVRPVSCPTCKSTSIVTTAKQPDADSYWRCSDCGDVWNAARAKPRGYGVVNHWK